jgi:hypothetical protein
VTFLRIDDVLINLDQVVTVQFSPKDRNRADLPYVRVVTNHRVFSFECNCSQAEAIRNFFDRKIPEYSYALSGDLCVIDLSLYVVHAQTEPGPQPATEPEPEKRRFFL